MTQVTKENFQSTIDNNELVLIDFYGDYCMPCKQLSPILDLVGAELGEQLLIAKVDAVTNADLAKEMSVRSIPAVFIFKNGKQVDKFVGLKQKADIIEMLKKYI